MRTHRNSSSSVNDGICRCVDMVETPGLEPGSFAFKARRPAVGRSLNGAFRRTRTGMSVRHCVLSAARLPFRQERHFQTFRAECSPHAFTCCKIHSPEGFSRSQTHPHTRVECAARVRTLDQTHVVKQRPGRTGGAGGACANTHATGRGHYLAAESLLGGFPPDLRGNLSWRGLPAVLVRLAPFRASGALKAAIYRA